MSHSDSKFYFRKGRAILIQGVNAYATGQKSNGSGKSAVQEAVSIAFTGKHMKKKITKSDMIMDGEKFAKVDMLLRNSSNEELLIKRVIKRGRTPNTAELLELVDGNYAVVKGVEGIDSVNTEIMSRLGITEDDLYNYFIMNKSVNLFYDLSDKDKKELIGRFSRTASILNSDDVIKDRLSHLFEEKLLTQSSIDRKEGSIAAYKEQLEERVNPERLRKMAISDIKIKISDKLLSIKKINDGLTQFNNDVSNVNTEINKNKDSLIAETQSLLELKESKLVAVNRYKKEKELASHTIDSIHREITDIKNERDNIEFLIREIRGQMRELFGLKSDCEMKLSGLIECPSCNFEFDVTSKTPKSELDALLENLTTDLDNMSKFVGNKNEELSQKDLLISTKRSQISTINASLEPHLDKISKATESILSREDSVRFIQNKVSELEARLSTKLQAISSSKQRIEIMTNDIKLLKSELKDIQTRDFTVDDTSAREKIRGLKTEISNLKLVVEQHLDTEQSLLEWKERFHQFYTAITNEFIGHIQHAVNDNLNSMKSELSISLSGSRKTQAGEVRDDITATVKKSGIISGVFHKHSEGEKARINLATVMSIQDIINKSTNNAGLDLLFMDEIMEGVDSHGLALIMNLLDKIGRTVVNITHVSSEDMMFDSVCTVEYDGRSRIITNYD